MCQISTIIVDCFYKAICEAVVESVTVALTTSTDGLVHICGVSHIGYERITIVGDGYASTIYLFVIDNQLYVECSCAKHKVLNGWFDFECSLDDGNAFVNRFYTSLESLLGFEYLFDKSKLVRAFDSLRHIEVG